MAGEFCQKKDDQGRKCMLGAFHTGLACKFWLGPRTNTDLRICRHDILLKDCSDPVCIGVRKEERKGATISKAAENWAMADRENDERQVANEMALARLRKENEVLRASRVYWVFSARQMIEKGDVEGMKLNAQNNEDYVRDLQQQRDNLRLYTRHLDSCPAGNLVATHPCTCGLEQALNPKART